MLTKIKDALQNQDSVLWMLAFTGVCVLVGLGKIKPETLELLLFGVIGAASNRLPGTSGGKDGQ